MDTKTLATLFTDLCKKGESDAAGQKYWSDDVVSLEPGTGDMARAEGRKAVLGKGEWWYANHTVHDVKVEGPYVHGNQFLVRFTLDVTPKGGQRMKLDEMGEYTVANGKIIQERFFYGSE